MDSVGLQAQLFGPGRMWSNGPVDSLEGVTGIRLTEHVFLDAWKLAERLSAGEEIAAFDEDNDGDTHCAELVKHSRTFAAPNAQDFWRQGRKLRPRLEVAAGTAIATFDENGRYPQGNVKHAAIFIGYAKGGTGILVLDQWNGTGLNYRELSWNYTSGNPHQNYVQSASNFSTIIW